MSNFPSPECAVFGIRLTTSLSRSALNFNKLLGARPLSGVNNFSGEGQETIHHVVVAEVKSATIYEETLVPSDNVTPSEEVQKVTNILNDIEEPVHTIRRKYLDNFQGKSTASTVWFNLYYEWLKGNFSTLEPEFYGKKI